VTQEVGRVDRDAPESRASGVEVEGLAQLRNKPLRHPWKRSGSIFWR
jgi:hypothetical protein